MSEDEPPELEPPDGTHEGVHLEANASEGATAIVAGRDVYITYAYGVRHRRRAESRGPVPKCPYPGLAAFEQQHAQWFFGRDELVSELTTRLDQRLRTGGMQMVVAPSGAGKTSLLRAGLLPRLSNGALEGADRWPKVVLTPTAEPLRALATGIAALTGGGVRLSPPRLPPHTIRTPSRTHRSASATGSHPRPGRRQGLVRMTSCWVARVIAT
ncbi:hypothetical protein ACFXKS_22885 [Streptomyces scopuliridis]|uniref:nSTAND1 domain-containing NTPase n=1 Tax=Streptomyces scopuliridis TaxID=452529 RepID=UPI003695036B